MLLNQLGIEAETHRIEINTHKAAAQHAFPGSPTIRVNGRDIDPDGARDQRIGLSCRLYHDAKGRVTPIPPEALIQQALKRETQPGGSI